nr:MAG TPA: hypothetical protein [Bacteriophage sp.]
MDHHIFAYQASFIYEKIDDASVLFSSIRKKFWQAGRNSYQNSNNRIPDSSIKVSRSYWTTRILLSG